MLAWIGYGVLVLVARIMLYVLSIPLFLIGSAATIKKKKFGKYLYNIAVALDVLGNVLGAPLWNVILIGKHPEGIKFGSRFDTISYVMGMNARIKNLTKFARFIAWILDKLDKDHLEKSIGLPVPT